MGGATRQVKVIAWTDAARESFDAFLEQQLAYRRSAAIQARDDVRKALTLIIDRPGVGRRCEWPGLKRWSLLRWRKIIIYREMNEGIRIIAFYDARQDLMAVDPRLNE